MNRLLLDTCTILRLASGEGMLSQRALSAIEAAAVVFVSPISLWEIALKARDGNLSLPNEPAEFFDDVVANYDLTVAPLSPEVMATAVELPQHHKDPADRFLIATALQNNLSVVTANRRFAQYGVEVLA